MQQCYCLRPQQGCTARQKACRPELVPAGVDVPRLPEAADNKGPHGAYHGHSVAAAGILCRSVVAQSISGTGCTAVEFVSCHIQVARSGPRHGKIKLAV